MIQLNPIPLNSITKKYTLNNKTVILKHLSEDSVRLLNQAKGVIEINIEEDPTYHVMPNK